MSFFLSVLICTMILFAQKWLSILMVPKWHDINITKYFTPCTWPNGSKVPNKIGTFQLIYQSEIDNIESPFSVHCRWGLGLGPWVLLDIRGDDKIECFFSNLFLSHKSQYLLAYSYGVLLYHVQYICTLPCQK